MQRILALQNLDPVGPDSVLDKGDVEVMISSCSYLGCGSCSSNSNSGCVPLDLMIVNA